MADVAKAVRARVYARDEYRCRHCGCPDDLTIDHVVPRVRGGSNREGNLQTLCRPCNMRKGAMVPPGATDRRPQRKKPKRGRMPRGSFAHTPACTGIYCHAECPVYLAGFPRAVGFS